MPVSREYVFEYRELAETLVKKADVHEGLWGIVVRFGFGATNVNTTEAPGEESLVPAAITTIKEIGIQNCSKLDQITL